MEYLKSSRTALNTVPVAAKMTCFTSEHLQEIGALTLGQRPDVDYRPDAQNNLCENAASSEMQILKLGRCHAALRIQTHNFTLV